MVQSTVFDMQVDGQRGPGRPKMTWKQLKERDNREWKLSAIDPHDRHTWRSGVRSAASACIKGSLGVRDSQKLPWDFQKSMPGSQDS